MLYFMLGVFIGNVFDFIPSFYQVEFKNHTAQPVEVILKTENNEEIKILLQSQQQKIIKTSGKGDTSYVLNIKYPLKNIIESDDYVSTTFKRHVIDIYSTHISKSEHMYFGF
jgi:hypothetical protein